MKSPIGAIAYEAQWEFASSHRGWCVTEFGIPMVEVMLETEAIARFVDGTFDKFIGIRDFYPCPTRRRVVAASKTCERRRVLERCEPSFASPLYIVRWSCIIEAEA